MSWKYIDHKADIAVEVTAKTVEDLFKNAQKALTEIVFENIPEKMDASENICIKANGFEFLLIKFLNELIYFIDSKKYAPVQFKLVSLNENKMDSIVGFSKSVMAKRYIKAATYHDLKLEKTEAEFKIKIVFDV